MENRQITIREVADDVADHLAHAKQFFLCFGHETCGSKICPETEFDQKQCRMDIGQEFLNEVNDNPELLKWAITGDETRVYGYNVETKALSSQSMLPEKPRPKKARQVRSNVKVLLTVSLISMA